jgi:hypothetical protein
MGKTFNVDLEKRSDDGEYYIVRIRERSWGITDGLTESEAKENAKDLIRCILDYEEGDGAGDQTFSCVYHYI